MAESKTRRIGVWVILILLFIGLIGFGTTGLSGNVRTLGTVGEKEVTVQDYANALSDQINAFTAATQQPLSFPQAQAIGLDQAVLNQLVTQRALDNETTRLGLSVGDEIVAEQVVQIPTFRGLDGSFNREAYQFTLERQGLSEAQFETSLREEMARTLVQGAVVTGIPAPDAYAEALARFIGEERDVAWIRFTADNLSIPIPPATPAELQAFHADNGDLFTTPERREVTYAWITPEMMQGDLEIDEDILREIYQERITDYLRPERRLVERLVLPDAESASAAAIALTTGGATFESLVADRGLDLSDVDLGDVAEDDLGPAGAAVFAAEPGDVVGPFETSLGPALFRMNAILDALDVPFEDAREDLRAEVAAAQARRRIEDKIDPINDLVAGGATLEDVVANTDMELGSLTWDPSVTDGIAAYAAFQDVVVTAQPGDFPELHDLDDGGLFVLRIDAVVPPAVPPLEAVREEVGAAWLRVQTNAALALQAERLISELIAEGGFTPAQPTPMMETGLTRRSFIAGTPPELIERIFDVAEGGIAMVETEDGPIIARVEAVRLPVSGDAEVARRIGTLGEQAGAAIADDLFLAFLNQILAGTEVQIDQAAINAVHSNLQ